MKFRNYWGTILFYQTRMIATTRARPNRLRKWTNEELCILYAELKPRMEQYKGVRVSSLPKKDKRSSKTQCLEYLVRTLENEGYTKTPKQVDDRIKWDTRRIKYKIKVRFYLFPYC